MKIDLRIFWNFVDLENKFGDAGKILSGIWNNVQNFGPVKSLKATTQYFGSQVNYCSAVQCNNKRAAELYNKCNTFILDFLDNSLLQIGILVPRSCHYIISAWPWSIISNCFRSQWPIPTAEDKVYIWCWQGHNWMGTKTSNALEWIQQFACLHGLSFFDFFFKTIKVFIRLTVVKKNKMKNYIEEEKEKLGGDFFELKLTLENFLFFNS